MGRALLSVADKRGIQDIARALHDAGLELISTGGTLRAIADTGVPVQPVESITGFPEMMDGRVKTLHPSVHGGILYLRENEEHVQQASAHGIPSIDVVVCNLYPFEKAISHPGVTDIDAIENIDIGGPTLIRAAAKNHQDVLVIVKPEDYQSISDAITSSSLSSISLETRRHLAAKAFAHTSLYDSMIASYLRDDPFPAEISIAGRQAATLRYGENPHQDASVYIHPGPDGRRGIGGWNVIAGGSPSYNNYLDATAAWTAAQEFEMPAAVIVKHNVPCGVAVDSDITVAFERALAGDPVSAFGGVIALNRRVSESLANVIAKRKYDVLLAPGYDDAALERLSRKKGLRIIDTSGATSHASHEYRLIPGGILAQTADIEQSDPDSWQIVSERVPTSRELTDLQFAWSVVKHVKSNAIVLCRENATVGICGGQPNRVDSVRMAVQRAGERATGSVLASDAFFPFADGVETAVNAGVTAIVQPGGSTRDPETIAAANAAGAAMVFTGIRHFRH